MVTEDELIKTITEEASVTREEVLEKIEEKEIEYSGLVSRIGAVYIVGREFGVELVKPTSKNLKIKNIVSDMNCVEFTGKVIHVSDVKEFKNDKGDGKVASIILGDETGTIRLSLWNEKADAVEKISVGDIFEVLGGYTKKDYRGMPEVRLSKLGNLKNLDNVEITVAQTSTQNQNGYTHTTLDKVNENDFISIKAHIVQIFERTIIHSLCPSCKKKIQENKCEVHGSVEPEKFLVVSGVIDDGYGCINAVFFRDAAEAVLQKTTEEIETEIKEKGEKSFFSSLDVLGSWFLLKGVIKKSNISEILEFSVKEAKKPDIINEINELLGGLKEKETIET
ncbi:MAG: hypothetical protein KAI53_00570 [Candidatus Aenigmarchaeota archaeon]|nr:hypothetical protein [Candidatus Aenigmarchaeota archaeon]